MQSLKELSYNKSMQMKEQKDRPVYDIRHGGAYDRGTADYYYARGRHPHFFTGDTYNSPKMTEEDMSDSEIAAYNAGYDDAAACGDRKDWR